MANRTARTEKKDEIFFSALSETSNVSNSAKIAGYSRAQVYNWRDKFEDFAEKWDDCIQEYIEELEAEADRRATRGVYKPVFYKGAVCGEIPEFSDNLLMFRLKALAPEKYRERQQIQHSGELTNKVMPVPSVDNVEDWESVAGQQQATLLGK